MSPNVWVSCSLWEPTCLPFPLSSQSCHALWGSDSCAFSLSNTEVLCLLSCCFKTKCGGRQSIERQGQLHLAPQWKFNCLVISVSCQTNHLTLVPTSQVLTWMLPSDIFSPRASLIWSQHKSSAPCRQVDWKESYDQSMCALVLVSFSYLLHLLLSLQSFNFYMSWLKNAMCHVHFFVSGCCVSFSTDQTNFCFLLWSSLQDLVANKLPGTPMLQQAITHAAWTCCCCHLQFFLVCCLTTPALTKTVGFDTDYAVTSMSLSSELLYARFTLSLQNLLPHWESAKHWLGSNDRC